MIQLTYIKEHYGVILPDWQTAVMKAHAYLIRKNREHPANEDAVEDLRELEAFIKYEDPSTYAEHYANIVLNTLRLDDMEDELYNKDYDGSLQELLRKGE